MNPDASRS